MHKKFVFRINPISVELGFTLHCDGVIGQPLRLSRLFEAVSLAAEIGQSLDFEIQIFDTEGRRIEVIDPRRSLVLAD